MSIESSNPYASPQVATERLIAVDSAGKDHLTAKLVKHYSLYRLLRLAGSIEADLEWNATWPIEFVRVNGRIAAISATCWYVPRFAFDVVSCYGTHHVVVDVRLSRPLPFTVRSFQLSVDSRTVYSEPG